MDPVLVIVLRDIYFLMFSLGTPENSIWISESEFYQNVYTRENVVWEGPQIKGHSRKTSAHRKMGSDIWTFSEDESFNDILNDSPLWVSFVCLLFAFITILLAFTTFASPCFPEISWVKDVLEVLTWVLTSKTELSCLLRAFCLTHSPETTTVKPRHTYYSILCIRMTWKCYKNEEKDMTCHNCEITFTCKILLNIPESSLHNLYIL